jgi:hypothetical protein
MLKALAKLKTQSAEEGVETKKMLAKVRAASGGGASGAGGTAPEGSPGGPADKEPGAAGPQPSPIKKK